MVALNISEANRGSCLCDDTWITPQKSEVPEVEKGFRVFLLSLVQPRREVFYRCSLKHPLTQRSISSSFHLLRYYWMTWKFKPHAYRSVSRLKQGNTTPLLLVGKKKTLKIKCKERGGHLDAWQAPKCFRVCFLTQVNIPRRVEFTSQAKNGRRY